MNKFRRCLCFGKNNDEGLASQHFSLSKFFVFHLSLVRICREKRLMNSVGAEPALKKRSAEGKGRKGKFEKRSLNLAEA